MKKFILTALLTASMSCAVGFSAQFYVSPQGSDANPGTLSKPFATLAGAQRAARKARLLDEPTTIYLRGGTYYMSESLIMTAADSGTGAAPVIYRAYEDEIPVLSGGVRLDLNWQSYKDGILKAAVPAGLTFDQLFVNSKRQIRARFPDYDMTEPGKSGYVQVAGNPGPDVNDPRPGGNDDMTFSGQATRAIVFDPKTFTKKNWADPSTAIIHAFQRYYWGNLQWQVKDLDRTNNVIWFGRGGWQMGGKYTSVSAVVNAKSRFCVENVFEELDTPQEWFHDSKTNTLYYMPRPGLDLKNAIIEVPQLKQLIRIVGTQDNPVRNITLDGFRITHTSTTFLEPYTIPSLSDWAIYRGGAVVLKGTRDCTVKDCFFDAVGGNAVFVNNYNRDVTVTGCKFTETGDSAICLVGSLELTNGTMRSFPYECRVTNNLIHDCGVFGKQMAGIYISRAKRITAAHNHIYNLPRAAVCIGDGTWGGHVIEYNKIHDTVRETGDHGPFNAWGRDRYWCLMQSHGSYSINQNHDAGNVLVDAMETTIIRNNFFAESSGWGIDLDDGASNYQLVKNICVGVSAKLREGDYRTVHNNIWYNAGRGVAFHLGYEDNHDKYYNNIHVSKSGRFYDFIAPPTNGPLVERLDGNLLFCMSDAEFSATVAPRTERGRGDRAGYSLDKWRTQGYDKTSVWADPLFVDPANNDFRVKPESSALKIGFENFPMNKWGLTESFKDKWRD